jgi:hypothetical protein
VTNTLAYSARASKRFIALVPDIRKRQSGWAGRTEFRSTFDKRELASFRRKTNSETETEMDPFSLSKYDIIKLYFTGMLKTFLSQFLQFGKLTRLSFHARLSDFVLAC